MFVKNFIGSFLALILILLFKNRTIKRINNKSILSLYFHKPTPEIFEKSIQWLRDNDFEFLDVKKMENILLGNLQIEKRNVFISFDDGWKENLSLIPIIEKYNIPILIFIPTEPILSGNFWWEYIIYSNSQNWKKEIKKIKNFSNTKRIEYIKKIKLKVSLRRSTLKLNELLEISKNELVTIGSHTVNHPITVKCNNDELELEYKESKEILSKWLNKDIHYFSFPNGDYNIRDINFIQKYNYRLAFTTKIDVINRSTSKYELPRYNVNNKGPMIINKAKILGLWQKYVPKYFLLSE